MRWYGNDAWWLLPFEKDTGRVHGDRLAVTIAPGYRAYVHSGLDVPGTSPTRVRIEFFATPPYPCHGLAPQDYPRVFAGSAQDSPHRQADGSLCLYAPFDPVERRWTSANGLVQLLNVVRDHLFCELHWQEQGVWPGDEAPHGMPTGRSAA